MSIPKVPLGTSLHPLRTYLHSMCSKRVKTPRDPHRGSEEAVEGEVEKDPVENPDRDILRSPRGS